MATAHIPVMALLLAGLLAASAFPATRAQCAQSHACEFIYEVGQAHISVKSDLGTPIQDRGVLLKPGQNGFFTIAASAPMATDPVEVVIVMSEAPALVWRNETSHRFNLEPSDKPEEYVLPFTVDPQAPPQRLTLTLSMASGNQTASPQWTIYIVPPEVASTMTAGGRNVHAHFAFFVVIGLAAAAGLSSRFKP
jgi:hypothetical protein